ncbi:4703_t:CDS:2, partial [Funneliformis geosporum]
FTEFLVVLFPIILYANDTEEFVVIGTDYNEYHCNTTSCKCKSGDAGGTCGQCAQKVMDVSTWDFYET